MKPLLSLLFIVALLGCASPERAALNTIGTVGHTADAAIGAYSVYIETHDVPREEILQVRRTVKAYILSLEVARKAVTEYKAGKGTKEAMNIAIDAFSVSSSEIIKLIQLLTQPPLNPTGINLQPSN